MDDIIYRGWHYWIALIAGNLDRYGPTRLQEAAYYGHVGSVRAAIEKGDDIEERGLIGMSPLCAAIYGGSTETTRLLIEHGARRRGVAVNKALHYAEAQGYSEVVQLLQNA
jgi:ankyrin repeat protein